jgi:hypothetical protein
VKGRLGQEGHELTHPVEQFVATNVAKLLMNFMVVDKIGDNIHGQIWILVFGQPWPNFNSSSADGGRLWQ